MLQIIYVCVSGGKKGFVFRKIWRALFSWNTRFELRIFALLPTKCNSINQIFPNIFPCFRSRHIHFHIKKNKSYEFDCCCYVVIFFLYFSIFVLSPFSMPFLYLLLMWRIFSLIPFSLLRRTLYSTWRSHYRQPQVLVMIFNKKTQNRKPTMTPFKFWMRIVVNDCLKNSEWNCFSFALISNEQ